MATMYGKLIQMIFFFLCLYVWPQFAHARDITWIPRSEKEYLEETKNVNCTTGLKPIITLKREGLIRVNKTVIVCEKDGLIPGQYCVENNTRGVQPDFTADCSNFSPPCDDPYNKSESYKFPECFERYGGILSPKEQEERYEKLLQKTTKEHQRQTRQIEDLTGKLQKTTKEHQRLTRQIEDLKGKLKNEQKELKICSSWKDAKTVVICFLSCISIFAIYMLIIVFLVKKYIYNDPITYKKFLKARLFVNSDILQAKQVLQPEEIPLTADTKIKDSVLKIESPRKHNSDKNSSKVPIEIEARGNRSLDRTEDETIPPDAQTKNGQMEKNQYSAVNNESPRKQNLDDCTKVPKEIEGSRSQDAKGHEKIPPVAHTKFGPLEKDQYSSVEDESPSEQYSFRNHVNDIFANDERGDSPDEIGQLANNLKDESPNKNTADNDSSVVPTEIDLRSSPLNFFVYSDVDIRQ